MSVNRPPRASEVAEETVALDRCAEETVALDRCAEPSAALAAAYERGGRVSLPTAGTTGPARRVIRTAASWVDSFAPAAELSQLGRRSRAYIPGPLGATMNLYAVALVHHVGAFRVADLPDATHAFLTPAALRTMLDGPGPGGGRGALHVVVAGDRLTSTLADRAERRGWAVSHYYGAAQLSFVAWGRDADTLRPFPAVAVRSDEGELWVDSPWVCEGEEVPAGLSPVLRRRRESARVWSTVGDRGEIGGDGIVRVHGREHAVTTGGVTVLTSDVESVLQPHASGDVYAVGLPHETLGAVVAVVCSERHDLEALPPAARRELAASHRPRRWLHLPTPPLTAAGKVDRSELAAWAARQR